VLGCTEDWIDVVGIVADVKHWGLEAAVNPELYPPLPQYLSRGVTFVVATDGDAASLAPALRDRVRGFDPDLPLSGVRTMEDVASVSVASRRAGMLLLAVFGGLALTSTLSTLSGDSPAPRASRLAFDFTGINM
jgi:putative ABC transport system permease protein